MRPVIQAPRRFGFVDLLKLIPRSVFGVGGVVRELIDSTAGWKAVIYVFCVILPAITIGDVLVREAIAPATDDDLRRELGEAAYWSVAIAAILFLAGIVFLLQWGALRLFGHRLRPRTLALAFAGSQLPQVPITIAALVVFGAAIAAGVDTSVNGTFSLVEIAVLVGLFLGYLVFAVAAAAEISAARAAAAVALGPGLLVALFGWMVYAVI